MSSQKGNTSRQRPQKHKNVRVFKNDLHDTSHVIKKINSLEFYGLCNRCKNIIDWKVKYKKYKPLTMSKKCVKCLEKKVKHAYYIVCQDCCTTHNICSKCSKPSEELEFGETESERRKREDQFQQELKLLSERQRRKFLRLLEKGLLTKENLIQEADKYKKEDDSKDDFGSDFDDLDDLDDLEPTDKAVKKQANKSNDKPESGLEEGDEDDDEFDDDEEDYDDEDEEEEEEEEE